MLGGARGGGSQSNAGGGGVVVVSTHAQPGELTMAVAGGAGPVGGEAGQPGFAAWLG